jgi:hypothetical protein
MRRRSGHSIPLTKRYCCPTPSRCCVLVVAISEHRFGHPFLFNIVADSSPQSLSATGQP